MGSEELDQELHSWVEFMIMPKLHCLSLHVARFVNTHGYFGSFSAEGFEHYQHSSKFVRLYQGRTQSQGAQVCSSIQYASIHSSDGLSSALETTDEASIKIGRELRMRKLSVVGQLFQIKAYILQIKSYRCTLSNIQSDIVKYSYLL